MKKKTVAEAIQANEQAMYSVSQSTPIAAKEMSRLAKALKKGNELYRIRLQQKNSNLGRNDLCSCGSGLKYKRCCLIK